MLRVVVLVLVLANAAYLVWVQGLLAPYGFAPASQAEPERLGQQIRPETIKLLDTKPAQPPASAASNVAPNASAPAASAATSGQLPAAAETPAASAPAAPPASAPPVKTPATLPAAPALPAPAMTPVAALQAAEPALQCLQAGPFTEGQATAMRARLQAGLPAGSWSFASNKSARWIVYMGKYVSKEAMNKKRAMLEQAGVSFEAPASAQLNPGLSLGSFKTKAQAEAALETLTEHGIRSAKVLPEHPETPTQWLRLPAFTPAAQPKAKTLVLQVSGKPLQACS